MTTRLSCNPQYYDYLHCIDFEEDGSCRFLDGGGQCIQLNLEGTYQQIKTDENHGKFKFAIDNKEFEVGYQIEESLSVFFNEVVWRIKTLDDWPITIYRRRYLLDDDPFNGLYANRENNLYFILEENKETDESLKQYYDEYNDGEEAKYGELDEEEKGKLDQKQLERLKVSFEKKKKNDN